jgi:hypothetical protein
MTERLQDLLSILELKIKSISDERRIICQERDAMAHKIIELQEHIDLLMKKIDEMKSQGEMKDQDLLLTSMVVEELLQELDDNAKNEKVMNE